MKQNAQPHKILKIENGVLLYCHCSGVDILFIRIQANNNKTLLPN